MTEPTPVAAGSYCTKCLKRIDLSEFLANDHLCVECAEAPETFPNASESHFEQFRPWDRMERK